MRKVRTPHRPQKTSTEMLEFFLFNYLCIIWDQSMPNLKVIKSNRFLRNNKHQQI